MTPSDSVLIVVVLTRPCSLLANFVKNMPPPKVIVHLTTLLLWSRALIVMNLVYKKYYLRFFLLLLPQDGDLGYSSASELLKIPLK